jgi:1,4-alpha-glucan branching enzyme
VPRYGYRVGAPRPGAWREIFNSDAEIYGGSNLGNGGMVQTRPEPAHGESQSLDVILPPLAVVLFKAED